MKHLAGGLILLCACTYGHPVGMAGGTVSAEGAAVEIPDGAVDGRTIVSIDKLAKAPPVPDDAVVLGAAYRFSATSKFLKPVTLTLPFDPSQIPADADMNGDDGIVILSQADGETGWTALPGGSVSDDNRVSAAAGGFSIKIACWVKHSCKRSGEHRRINYACVCDDRPVTRGYGAREDSDDAANDRTHFVCPKPDDGSPGPSGTPSPTGSDSPSGSTDAPSGPDGPSGPDSPSGPDGPSGTSGPQGGSGCLPTYSDSNNGCFYNYAPCGSNNFISCGDFCACYDTYQSGGTFPMLAQYCSGDGAPAEVAEQAHAHCTGF